MHAIDINPAMLARGRLNRGGNDQAFTELDMSRVAHIVVDMQVGFMAEGALVEVPEAREIVTNINSISQAVREAGGVNIFLRYTYDGASDLPWTSWYSGLLSHPYSGDLAAAFTPGNAQHELWPDLVVMEGEAILNKTRFSGFTAGTCNLHAVLQEKGIDTVIITGTLTNCCCESTARDAHQMNYKVIFVSDGNAALTDEEHNATLGSLYVLYSDVVTAAGVIELVAATSQYHAAAD